MIAHLKTRTKGVALSLFGITLLSPDSLLLRLINADVWTLVFWRGGLSAIGLICMTLLIDKKIRGREIIFIGKHGVAVAVGFAVSALAFVFAIMNTAVSNALVIMSISPLLAAILSYVLFREATASRTWIAATAITVGLGSVFLGSLETNRLAGDLSALIASMALAFCFVMIRKHREVNMLPSLAWSGFLVCLLVSPLAAPASVTGVPLLLTILLCLFIVPVGMGMITLSPRYISAPEVSLIMRLEVLLAPFWVWLMLGEVPSIQTLIGGVIILASLTLLSILSMRSR